MSTTIKTAKERLASYIGCVTVEDVLPLHAGVLNELRIEEVEELRAALSLAQDSCESNANAAEDYYREKQSLLDQRENWRCLAAKFEQERDELKAQLQELNLQYVSDFGQLQEKVEGLFSEYDMQNSSFAADARCIFERSTT